MAWVAREKNAHRSVAIPGRVAAKIDATPGAARAAPRRRSYRSVGENRWRFHRSALRPRRAARWRSLRARAATGAPLRAGTGFQARDSAKTETAIRRQKHSRFAFPRRVMALDRSLLRAFRRYPSSTRFTVSRRSAVPCNSEWMLDRKSTR